MRLSIPAFRAYHKFAIEMLGSSHSMGSGMASAQGQPQDVTDAVNATFLKMKEESGDPNASFDLGQVLGRVLNAPDS